MKEPWEYTQEEFITPDSKTLKTPYGDYHRMIMEEEKDIGPECFKYNPDDLWTFQSKIPAYQTHRLLVQQALLEGKNIPLKVLKEYPDLNIIEISYIPKKKRMEIRI